MGEPDRQQMPRQRRLDMETSHLFGFLGVAADGQGSLMGGVR